MILPSDDDSRKPGDDEPPWGGQPGDPKRPHKGDDASPADDDEEEDDDEDDDDEEFDDSILFQDDEPDAASFPGDMTAEGSGIKAPAPPGWREELREELDECIDELAEIEDPSQDFDPPDPPDLFTFYGELAALRNELRRAFRRSAETAEKFGGALQSLAAHATDTPASLPVALALISMADRISDIPPNTPLSSALEAALTAAGISRVPTAGLPFDPATMTMVGTAPAPEGTAQGTVLSESSQGFRNRDGLLRPASVTVAA